MKYIKQPALFLGAAVLTLLTVSDCFGKQSSNSVTTVTDLVPIATIKCGYKEAYPAKPGGL